MVSELKKKKWARFKGEPHWIRCFAHVLNLIAQAILRPFGSQKKSKTTNQSGSIPLDDSEDSGSGDEDEDAEEQIRPYSQGLAESSSFHEDVDESNNESIAQNDQEETELLTLENIDNASDEGDSDAYTTEGCKQTLAKVDVSHRLIFN
ncbi:hypothetical protein PGTUg99_024312 [Puccinia graminis f. sp. tritici]|uniref:Uncharacterized protein n=1 Tax=Puccinia graminis f. sp. tritici TaxID=56615 RepID=A0A5B0NHK0_PUCGR|nr:hypothetical protein PGTUg99_024312 [Puccinia graminis f. sp. tritici]